ncbi:MAG: UDP-N-acetylmuramoyl-tripeptide--D-alanyl-D-alanine ligase [Gemmatimonadota bacterium]|jgi:UDP-N-acetylmuramoyl-tripeptide--D-alanyl-D-alanine ligase|nr:UDP-N-acetylmuramoyl-tripeptide--D-alanyl-D-alanine ligase [Gemmatimonadota bacterium]MDQ8150297.1 UDP-N-acetylmuramoyl-tripeptide--D-alanyl-D-alanine ligase [Gemmatimonadota bacterium]MDQ8175485.1 UDP-N-acetylmuramoyl-tripeptide--D-alanyl-D-alanine ligase [Gemmatimonadota bacterium]MDQ8178743.1 UDP-N-acetylmuramoyl-tripeptide--D-alanyl-D-alanine ligase [Gemmatimonadota bacterium]
MSFWTVERVAAALGQGPSDGRPLGGITTDTRALAPGSCFVALRGERFDAHDYLAQAVTAGAAALVVEDATRTAGLGVPVFTVEDTHLALADLARYRRLAWARPVVAVGGSNGKTSTKELLKAVLGSRLRVHATTGNLNNRVGVPLTLLALDDAADVAVIEVGTNQPGEIAFLRDVVRPDLAVVTTVQEEHLEGFGDLAGVMAEELALCDEVPIAVVPAAEPEVVAEATRRAGRVVAVTVPTTSGVHADGLGWIDLEGTRVELPLRGRHNVANAALALAVGREFGIAIADAARGIAAMPLPSMRSAVTPLGRALLLNDAYNANPGSAKAALALLTDIGAGRQRVVVLGTMRELGAAAARAHREVAEVALAGGFDLICGIGEFVPALEQLALGDPRILLANDVEDLWPQLQPRLAPDAAILLKASRGVALERLVPPLTTWATA